MRKVFAAENFYRAVSSRRDLNTYERSLLALKIKPDILAKQAKERQGTRTDLNIEDKCPQSHIEKTITPEKNKIDRENKTNFKLAEIAGVSDKTVQRYKKIQQSAPEEVKAKVDSGEISINAAYKKSAERFSNVATSRDLNRSLITVTGNIGSNLIFNLAKTPLADLCRLQKDFQTLRRRRI